MNVKIKNYLLKYGGFKKFVVQGSPVVVDCVSFRTLHTRKINQTTKVYLLKRRFSEISSTWFHFRSSVVS